MKKTYIMLAVVFATMLVVGFFAVRKTQAPQTSSREFLMNSPETMNVAKQQGVGDQETQKVPEPTQVSGLMDNALSRITKKPFGILIAPKTSPVQPERFSGYHTAVDLETFPEEQNKDVAVKILCDGKLLSARNANGYGGVAVQSCVLDGQAVTVVYGHIKLSSIAFKVGDQLKAGEFLANLGDAYSGETDGERKHLHLGIHKGSSMNILGYVQSKSELSNWLDPQKFLN
ncbi:MAG: Peptidase M23 [uncultured bacterium]|nr:MAG: Peptidase M23 [uncultured bacterium]